MARKRVLHNQIRAASGFLLGTDEEQPAPEFDDLFGQYVPQLVPLQSSPFSILRRN